MFRLPLLLALTFFTGNVADAKPAKSAKAAAPKTYYLAPDGKDSANGLSEATPLRTLYKINELAKPGDTFILGAGTYELGKSFPTFTCAGTAKAPIRIQGADGARPRLRFEGWSGMKFGPGAAHIEVSGLDIEGVAASITLEEAKAEPEPKKSGRLNGNGITIDGRGAGEKKPRPHHITLRDLRVWACPGGGISAMQCDYITVEDCTVSACAWYSTFATSGISIWQAWAFDNKPGYHSRIVRNRCFDNRQLLPANAGGKITDGNGIIIDDTRNTQQGSKLGVYPGRILVEGNVCVGNGGSGISAYESEHVDILRNVVWLNNTTPEQKDGQIFVNHASDIRIEGNTIVAPEGKDATNNMHWSDKRPPNENIVWKDNAILRGKPGKGTEEGNVVLDLPLLPPTP